MGDDQRRPRQRPVRLPRRRRHLEAARARRKPSGEAKPNGLPEGLWGKIGVAVAPSNSQRVYALIEAEKGGLFRSDDGGETWERVNDDRALRQRAWYYSTLTVHPTNPDVVCCPQVPLLKSIDGGKTFSRVTRHAPRRPPRPLDRPEEPRADDRQPTTAAWTSRTDGGKTWYAPPLPIASSTTSASTTATPYRVMGTMQDLGTASGPSNSLLERRHPARRLAHRRRRRGRATSSPTRPTRTSSTPASTAAIITRYDHRTGQARNITRLPVQPVRHRPGEA